MMSVWPIRPECLTQPLCQCLYDFVKEMFTILPPHPGLVSTKVVVTSHSDQCLLRISQLPSAQTRVLSANSVAVSHRSTKMHLHKPLKEAVHLVTQADTDPVLIGNNPQ